MTVRFKNELVRNITIKLGYANAKVRLTATVRVSIQGDKGTLIDIHMRKRGLPAARELPFVSL